jgi:hypothetical protein
MDHPVVQVVATSALRGVDERYVLDDETLKNLDKTLLAHSHDPSLPCALMGLMGLATVLEVEEHSPTAAEAIFAAIRGAMPHFDFVRANAGLFDDPAASQLQKFLAEREGATAPHIEAKAPGGTLKVSSFAIGKLRRP